MTNSRRGKCDPSCGRGNWNVKHGAARRGKRFPEYGVWAGMLRRCIDKNNTSYPDYGGRGISVCESWSTFENFIADMGRRPTPKHTIERVNNDGNYEPTNCKWVTRADQAKNKRKRKPPTHCKRGHQFSTMNTYIRPNGKRTCKTCRRADLKRLQHKGYFRMYAKARKHGASPDVAK